MTAVVEIHVDRLKDVVTVPVQAVVQIGKETACYVAGPTGPERRPVKLGRTNDKAVQILEGVVAGDRVVLNPMAIAEEAQRPAGGEAEPAENGSEQISTAPSAQPPAAPAPAARQPRRPASTPAKAS
jgi:multidrug efflux pump subunit AcrA (membrane-fusion protein)